MYGCDVLPNHLLSMTTFSYTDVMAPPVVKALTVYVSRASDADWLRLDKHRSHVLWQTVPPIMKLSMKVLSVLSFVFCARDTPNLLSKLPPY